MENKNEGKTKTKSFDDFDDIKKKIIRACFIFAAIVAVMLAAAGIHDAMLALDFDPKYESYSTFEKALQEKKLYGAFLSEEKNKVYYQYVKDVPKDIAKEDPSEAHILEFDKSKWCYVGYSDYDALKELLITNDMYIIEGKFDSYMVLAANIVSSLFMMFIMCIFIYIMISIMLKQVTLGGSKYEIDANTGIKFEDVIGHDEILSDIRQYVTILGSGKKMKDAGITPPKGLLFTGPPGTGKTMIAKAMAMEAGVPFMYMNASNVIEMFVGVGAKTIRSCYAKAKSMAPCIVFIDEIDAIGGSRNLQRSGTSEDTQTLLALLQEMDGFSGSEGILTIAATNDPDILDPALRRAGRFDREIIVSPPRTAEIRRKMLEHYTKDLNLDDSVDLDMFSKEIAGSTGADIASVCNEAAIVGAMKAEGEVKPITMDDLHEALDKLMLKGSRVDKNPDDVDRKVTAYHEAGHAVADYLTGRKISRISIRSMTSGVGGFVMSEDNGRQFATRNDIENQIITAYAGRVSEEIKFGDVTTGAVNDIEQATSLLMKLVTKYGFSDMGMLDYSQLIRHNIMDSSVITDGMKNVSSELMEKTRKMLKDNYGMVERLAEELLSKETITGDEAEEILEQCRNS